MKPLKNRTTLITAALAAVVAPLAVALTTDGVDPVEAAFAAQEGDAAKGSDADQDADAKKQDADKQDADKQGAGAGKGDGPQVGRGRRSGKGDAPKPVPVPRIVPPAPGKPAAGGDKPAIEPGVAKPGVTKPGVNPNPVGKSGRAVPAAPRNPNAKLDIEFGTDTHNFGRARQGDLLTHTFKMRSAGTEPLIITQASPTCGCTLGEVRVVPEGGTTPELYTFGNPIDPGAEIELEATLDTASKSNDTQVRIQVYSNDGKSATQSLTLKANIEPFIVASPPYVQLGNIRQGDERTARVTFRTTGGEKVLLTEDPARQSMRPEGLSIDVTPINPDENGKAAQWQANFKVDATAKEGPAGYLLRLNTDIELPTNAKKAEQLKLAGKEVPKLYYHCDANISYNIIGALAVQPLYLSMGLIRPGQPLVRSTRLTAYEADFDLSGVEARLEGQNGQPLQWADSFKVAVKPVSGSNAVDIELRLDGLPEEADGAFRGMIVIETGHPDKPEVEVRFSGVCRKLAGQTARPAPTVKRVNKFPESDEAAKAKKQAEAEEAAKKAKEKADAAKGNSDAGKGNADGE